jgi:oligoendopeptidase F
MRPGLIPAGNETRFLGWEVWYAVRMSLLPFGSLPRYRQRRFLPENMDLGDWSQIEPQFNRLEAGAGECGSVEELERWILDWGELSAALDEESSRRYIAMSCHTDDPGAEKAYLHYIETIDPQTKPRQFALARGYVDHPLRTRLPSDRYAVFDRDMRLQVELFRPENVELEKEEAKLGQQYQKRMGALTVPFQGEERTLVQMGRFLEEPDRALREEAWSLSARRRLQEKEELETLFDQLLALRGQMAKNAGFGNYRDYAFRKLGRFDYTPAHCEAFHAAVESDVMPLQRQLQARRREAMRLDALRPWDLSVDPQNRPPLRPFQQSRELVAGGESIFRRLDAGLADDFQLLSRHNLLDLDNRRGKAPGGYQATLAEARLPFIFMNAVGMQRDVETLLHEAGHAFHSLASREEDIYHYQHAPIEFCEVASMSMELLGGEFLDVFYADGDAARARRTHLEGVVGTLTWIATIDAFQHWLYTHPGHGRDERNAAWLELATRFGGETDWSDHEEVRTFLWHRQLHIFLYPFYYIEYGIAQLGALQVWLNSRKDKAGALADYKRALALGGSRPLPELFAAAGCPFDFSSRTVKPLMDMVERELDKLEE